MTAKELGDQPAFPMQGTCHSSERGFTKLELFTALAMQGLCASSIHGQSDVEANANEAIYRAHTQLEALAKEMT